MPPDLLAEVADLLDRRADAPWGLHGVTQREHALQAAMLAERDGQPEALPMPRGVLLEAMRDPVSGRLYPTALRRPG